MKKTLISFLILIFVSIIGFLFSKLYRSNISIFFLTTFVCSCAGILGAYSRKNTKQTLSLQSLKKIILIIFLMILVSFFLFFLLNTNKVKFFAIILINLFGFIIAIRLIIKEMLSGKKNN